MARGRMINSKITRNKAVNDLSDDTSRLAYTWLITFADVEGRTNGDPALVRSLVFPRRTDVSVERMEQYIREWAAAGLVIWYEAEGDMYLAFPTFAENQRGLDRRKEQPSEIPAPPEHVLGTESVRTEYVPGTAEEKLREDQEKRRGREGEADAAEPRGASAPTPPPPEPVVSSEESVKPAPVQRARKSTADPRSAHPAIQAVREALGGRRYPPRELYDGLISTLGDNPDVGRLKSCREAWVLRGYNQNAWTWATEWYAAGVPERIRSPVAQPAGMVNGRPTGAAARAAWRGQGNGDGRGDSHDV